MRFLRIEKLFGSRRGFTLMEIMVASVIGVFVAAVAVGAARAISVSSEIVETQSERASEIRFASGMLSSDLNNIYRDLNMQRNKFVGMVEEAEGGVFSSVTFYTVSRTKARSGEVEGGVYEVEYLVEVQGEKSVLMRRYWPNPDKEREVGGIVTVIAEDIGVFEGMYFDGSQWQLEWPEELEQMPEMVEFRVGSVPDARGNVIFETFLVNFVRGTGTDPEAAEEDEGEGEDAEGENNEEW